jgi:hypothetical protein
MRQSKSSGSASNGLEMRLRDDVSMPGPNRSNVQEGDDVRVFVKDHCVGCVPPNVAESTVVHHESLQTPPERRLFKCPFSLVRNPDPHDLSSPGRAAFRASFTRRCCSGCEAIVTPHPVEYSLVIESRTRWGLEPVLARCCSSPHWTISATGTSVGQPEP